MAKDIWNSLVITHQGFQNDKKQERKVQLTCTKAKKELSDEETSTLENKDEEYAMEVRDFKKFFRRRGKFVRQPYNDKKALRKVKDDKNEKVERKCFRCGNLNHFIGDYLQRPQRDQKAFVGGTWSDSEEEEELKKDGICLMTHESNEIHSESLYYSSSSLDDKTPQTEYNKLCKISLKIINKNKLLKTKAKLLENKIFELKKIKRLEKDKGIDLGYKSFQEILIQNSRLKQAQDSLTS
nr:zf-CCHC domain-containing protein/UBN2 domain-containing protein [Tanacetum cinerariifolium]